MHITRKTEEIVFPSSPSSPPSLLELSNVDQTIIRVHVPTFLFFKQPSNIPSNVSEVLRSSLRELLSYYYPLAGRYRERENGMLYVECCDQGVHFIEVWADISVEAVQPEIDFDLLVPIIDLQTPISEIPILLVQVTHFEGGAFCLSLFQHHTISDARSAAQLLKAWAGIASGKGIGPTPCFDRSLLKARQPPVPSFDHIEYQIAPSLMSTTVTTHASCQEITSKTFRFTATAMDALKVRACEQCKIGSSYTRFEALSAHLWRRVTRARGLDAAVEVRLGMTVDGRRKLIPSLPEGYYGNVVFFACAVAKAGELVEKPLPYAAGLVHDAIARITDEYMRSSLDWIELQTSPKLISRSYERPFIDLSISSWSRIPFADLDFGWGKPSFDFSPRPPFDGYISLLPAPLDLGHMDAFVGLRKDHMASLESQLELFSP